MRVLRIATGWSALIALAFFGLSALSLRTDDRVELARVHQAFVEGIVQVDGEALLAGNTGIGTHQWNDCLVLHQAIDRRAGFDQLLISPLDVAMPSGVKTTPCVDTEAMAAGRSTPRSDSFYHRYFHGHTVAARLLLPALSVASLRHLYSGGLAILLLAGIAQTLTVMTQRQRVAQGCVWLILQLAFARFYGLESFGQSLAHGPADLVLVGFLVFLAWQSSHGGMRERAVPAAAAIFGALTMIFEFLTGGLPLGLALLIGGLPFALRTPSVSIWRSVAHAVLAYVVATVVIVAIKAALVWRVFGPASLVESLHQLLFRMSVVGTPAYGDDVPGGFRFLVESLVANLQALAAGEPLMVAGMLAIGMVGGALSLRRLLREGGKLSEGALALATSNLVIVSWMLAFVQHTAQHARFMDRLLIWPIASGLAIIALDLMQTSAASRMTDKPSL